MLAAKHFLLLLSLLLLGNYAATAEAEEGLLSRLGPPTIGGPLNWTDEVVYGEWRIQKHETLGHYRLLNPHERRLALGSLSDCFIELQRRRQAGEIPPMPPHVVIAIHGLAGSRNIMEGLGKYLEREGGFTVITFGYASTKGTIQEQTVALESVIRNLEGVQEVSFVAHSMGNLLVRHLMFRFQVQDNPPPIVFRRMVMISPPNHGAEIADTVGQRPLFQLALGGEVVDQFAPRRGWPQLEQQLAIPPFEFGIIAGGRGNDQGYLPRVPGDDDGLLSLQTHMLSGATDFLQTGGLHQLMPRYKSVREATLLFLQCGHF